VVDLLRPEPRPSWRSRVSAAVSAVTVARLATAAGAVLLLAVTAWWLLRSPAPPVERSLPVARSAATTGGAGSASPSPASPAGASSSSAASPAGASASGAGPPLPSTTAVVLLVQAAGAVASPGVYRVPPGARVLDVVTAAGGPTASANLQAIALASRVVDGQRVYVPAVGEAVTGDTAVSAPPAPLDLNQATVEQLDDLPGVGPATAQAIVDYRSRHGPLVSVDDLLEVRGIGPAKLDAFRDLVTVG
jgi:competence protein ComEA